jgi:FkbM family methyltransferase
VVSARPWVPRIAAQPTIEPFPGWFVGAGQSGSFSTRIRKTIWRSLRDPFEVAWLDGLRLTLYPGNEISRSIFVTGRYEPNEFHALSRFLRPGMTFIDVGANMGLYTLFAAKRLQDGGRVVSIEPSQRERAVLQQNIELNQLPNVTVLPAAACERAGEVELLVADSQYSGHNTLGDFGYNTPLDHREVVPAITLDSLLESEPPERVDVIKMDIEGGELSALRGAHEILSQHRPALLLELSDRALAYQKATSAEVLSVLESHGYRVYGFDRQSGLPVPLQPKDYFDSENVVALATATVPW